MIKINLNHGLSEKKPGKPRILVAPLDWGLGHATRCIPVIYALQPYAEVWLAGEGAQAALLKQEFPGLPFLSLQGYRVRYGRSARTFLLKMLLQSPRLLYTVRQEHSWLKKAIKQYGFDAVVSDNRFGLYHPSIPSIFITHQLQVKGNWGKGIDRLMQQQNYRFISRFTSCWVPDAPGATNLAGALSHPPRMPDIPVTYIGLLSRLEKKGLAATPGHLFISLSGPEPQRSLLENKVIADISHYKGTATIVRGLPGTASLIPSTNDIRFYNHLDTRSYSKEMESAGLVIARSGYSTVMDLAGLQKKAVLIPTPGQTEQEYLAQHLSQQGFAPFISQEKFSLQGLLDKATKFSYRQLQLSPGGGELQNAVQALIDLIRKK